MENLLIQTKDIVKSFFGVTVLSGIDFELRKGEVHALMGENGAGKSTLAKIISGVYQADSGDVLVEGEKHKFRNTRESTAAGIALVSQEFSLLPDFSVAENLFLMDNSYYKNNTFINKKAMVRDTRELLKLFDMQDYIDPYTNVSSLSVAQCQVVEILKAISKKAKVIILDEPTASLTQKEIDLLFDLVRKLKADGVGFIMVSHKINEIFEICDRCTVLRDGKMAMNAANISDITQNEMIQAMVGREVNNLYGSNDHEKDFDSETPMLEVTGLCDAVGYVTDASIKVRKGEIVGLSGLVGSGRTEFVRAIFGVDGRSAGTVSVNGKVLPAKNIIASMNSGIGFVPEDRKVGGLLQELTILVNSAIATNVIEKGAFTSRDKEFSKCADMVGKMAIKVNNVDNAVKSLSGGNQQKILLAKWLMLNPELLIIDEPTRGVDIGAKADIYAILRELAASGMAVLMVSSEMPEIIGLCDTVYVMREGRIRARLTGDDIDDEKIGYYSTIG